MNPSRGDLGRNSRGCGQRRGQPCRWLSQSRVCTWVPDTACKGTGPGRLLSPEVQIPSGLPCHPRNSSEWEGCLEKQSPHPGARLDTARWEPGRPVPSDLHSKPPFPLADDLSSIPGWSEWPEVISGSHLTHSRCSVCAHGQSMKA